MLRSGAISGLFSLLGFSLGFFYARLDRLSRNGIVVGVMVVTALLTGLLVVAVA